ncbi:hypothetical protein [Maribacter antarcticus]|uniref:hypothetical protein n=1 Tax=Maribacter antarcticus TaxID=505250 RepID=UPI00047C5235|nr:hypothetical protein [Maribacter antarcticus]
MNKKEQFIYYSSPERWLHSALELHGSLEELYALRNNLFYRKLNYYHDQRDITIPGHSKATYLLMSYILENLLKGIAILNDPNLVNKGKIEKQIKTHDLNHLSKLNGFELTEKSKIFQDTLSDLCVSNARYPIGLNEHNKMKDPSFTEHDFELFKTLFKMYKEYLVIEFSKNGWNSGLKNELLNTKPNDWNYVEKN